ncbi:MAG: prepilin-type N-terminal cleavage/methylation domain-containing protein [Lagierella massiliensis]|nr:prepilin-type N-terminal cleavage/methylation domain-containing protein [Lagierella massiliensis]
MKGKFKGFTLIECLVALFILFIIATFTLPALENILKIRDEQKSYMEFTNYSKTVSEKIISELLLNKGARVEFNSREYKVNYKIKENNGFKLLTVKVTRVKDNEEISYETILPK